jgi:hypothetical protein
MEKKSEEHVKEWVRIYETDEKPLADLLEARLSDENIEYQVRNNSDVEQTVFVGNIGLGLPIQLYVKENDVERVLVLMNEDRSDMLKGGQQFGTLEAGEESS